MRADKYLHNIRIFKTRSLAAQACGKGNVALNGVPIKPSRELRPGDLLQISRGDLDLKIEVVAFPEHRVGAAKVAEFCRNLTPPEAYQKAAEARRERELAGSKPHEDISRPNKKQLRELREWLGRE